jgi:transposase
LRDQRQRVQLQIESLLEEMRIKLSSVVSDLLGASGRRILEAMATGEEDPAKLARLGDERLKASEQELQKALRGRVQAAHRLVLGLFLKQIALLEEQITVLEQEISAALQPHQAVVERLAEIPGLGWTPRSRLSPRWGRKPPPFRLPGKPPRGWVSVQGGKRAQASPTITGRQKEIE